MDIFEDDTKRSSSKHKVLHAGFEEMMRMRKKSMPEFKKAINKEFKDYGGEMVAIIRVMEDENGMPTTTSVYIGGAASLQAQVSLARGLDRTANEFKETLLDICKDNPEALLSVAKDMLGDVLGDIVKELKKKGK